MANEPSETIVVHKGHGLPYSKGLMAQALSATALSQECAFELARLIETRLAERAHGQINVAALHVLAEEVLLAEEGGIAAGRYRRWRRLDRLDRPLVVLIGGTTGVGKSTLASMLAARLGVNRVIATDVVRQVLRAFFTLEAMPTVHHSAFEAGGITGYRGIQAKRVGTGIAAIVERAANEGKPVVARGCTWCPGVFTRACASDVCWWKRSWWCKTPTCIARTSRCGPEHGRPSVISLNSSKSAASRITWGSGPARRRWRSSTTRTSTWRWLA